MKSLLLSLLLLLSINAFAQEIELDGIMYSVDYGIATLEYVNPMADSISKNSESVFRWQKLTKVKCDYYGLLSLHDEEWLSLLTQWRGIGKMRTGAGWR